MKFYVGCFIVLWLIFSLLLNPLFSRRGPKTAGRSMRSYRGMSRAEARAAAARESDE